jgi:ABC-type multidrug transport system ATPase subunit
MTDLICTDLTLCAGAHVIAENISLTVRAGELVALLGPNGAG